ncbi:Re/Si-specific NAD(P)(+) transhydrogenase subunit alpha [Legionella taurinensis]|uniref:NAD(P) transhydrogenase subunit alpha part 1 n=1 Tax=Legionella taurinensis TaxID=70611 RepID=A0A3A5L4Z6_9GAMM|nr:Re/Si-specific NAD(P)(+) transhydrogenase subunit alpha [Legionella taurinensis]MDX1838828.1 Re/Si-specific NAD(P)(+) transhydrogenase subunit alpha [Legionella taurinensis]PUT38604.1 Re/Si-specific NAD(P)(+) transhydrogenase subunit alpha [Legionella taurinensis]PUT39513.1 Re/Si-specific NAD(P)(+) transhydrogenase subunit alpha [Legionella taurinensis]PUT41639.1 Re/Si-specific NAD(P)(+) transhydrogenase subunit alpha [Legionella taurinensis]PUT45016.1 Re/Si-specific NAD(P)(+) transhydrogen
MIIVALNEHARDTRAAITPNSLKHYQKLGLTVHCEQNVGAACGFTDSAYQEAGAVIVSDRALLLQEADILACVSVPSPADLPQLKRNALLIAPFDNEPESPLMQWCQQQSITAFSMNLIPRISRAQSMDSLSSQANLAGYRAVLEGVAHFNRAIPMMMTAAGMIHPAKVLILGAGVAGLQAIATAKRLGAVVYAFDVRRAAKEQVESLGAEFIEVSTDEDSETSGGYAREMSEEYKKQQAELIHQYATQADIVVTTALIPGRPAPVLITRETVNQMKPGSVIVDIATSRGGNCELSQRDEVIHHQGVTIVGYSNLAGFIPATASELYANNVVNLLKLLVTSPDALTFNAEDEIVKQATLTHEGRYFPFQTTETKEAINA